MESSQVENYASESNATGYLQETIKGENGKIYYLNGTKAVIGRNIHAEVPIPSCNVSRIHALLNYTKDGWNITDNKSVNGVYVNDEELKPGVPHLLETGQSIFIGPPELTDYVFVYKSCPDPQKMKDPVQNRTSTDNCSMDSAVACCSLLSETVTVKLGTKQSRKSKRRAVLSENEASVSELNQDGHFDKRKCLDNTEMSLEDRLVALNTRMQANEEIEKRITRKLVESDAALNESMDLNGPMCSNKESESLLPENNNTAESHPYSWDIPADDDIFFQYPSSLSATQKVSDQCTETECKSDISDLKEQLATLQEQLKLKEQMRMDLQKELQDKDNMMKEQEEQKKLLEKKGAEELKSNLAKAQLNQQNIKEEAVNQFGNLMEAEFTCSICTELFVQATTLDCSHTFCKKCIAQWKKKKKQCPICRARIVGETKSLVIDGFIDKMVEKLSTEYQERRKAVVKERADSEKKKKRTNAVKPIPRTTRSSTVNRIAPSGNLYQPWIPLAHTEIVIGDDGGYYEEMEEEVEEYENLDIVSMLRHNYYDDDDDSDSDDDSPVEGYGYYAGYGRCYNCGRTGHWANGCPEM